MISLQRQLKRSLLISLLVVMGGLLSLVDWGVQQLTGHYVLGRLQHDAESLIAALEYKEQRWSLNTARLSTLFQRVHSGHYYMLFNEQTDIRSRSLWDYTPTQHPLKVGETSTSREQGISDQYWLTWSQNIHRDEDNLTLWIAEDISDLYQTQARYRLWAVALLLCTLVLLLLIQQKLLSRAFAHLAPVTEMIRQLHHGALSDQRRELPEEVQPLVEEIERLLAQLEQRVSRSRNALGNLAHELKRPLQRLQLTTDQLDSPQQKELEQALQELRWMIERELKRARIAGVSSPGRHTSLSEEIPPLTQVLARIYPDCKIECQFPPRGVMPQDRDDMLELLGNLLDNACKYAAGKITLHFSEKPTGWLIQLVDNGSGITEEERHYILQRGTRLDESHSGSGLGLAICCDIVSSYHGELKLLPSEPTGLTVEIFLPDSSIA